MEKFSNIRRRIIIVRKNLNAKKREKDKGLAKMQIVDGFKEIFSQKEYDTIACDIYGVIHDGIQAYPFSKDALTQCKANGDHVILLSNSTRLQDRLDAAMSSKFGITNDSYQEILSSGVLTKLFLKDIAEYLETNKVKSASCHATARQDGRSMRMEPEEFASKYLKTGKFFLAGDPDWQEPLYLPLAPTITRTMDWDEMEFLLLGSIRGVNPDRNPIDPFNEEQVQADYRPLLAKCLEKGIPVICANPDVFAPNGVNEEDGSTKLLICPGYVGKMYEDMGGKVLYFGKPFKSIYEFLIENKTKFKNSNVICVGDNITTDIKGATEAGLDVVMILGGVHNEELKSATNDEELKAKVKELCVEHGSKEPTYLMRFFKY